jgi:MFS family permease
MPMYGLAIAHANDSAARGEFVRVSSGLLLAYAVGAVIGPMIAGVSMTRFGPSALFIHTGIIQALLAVFGLYRITQRRSRPAAEQSAFVGVPETSPEVFRLDPRAEELASPTP